VRVAAGYHHTLAVTDRGRLLFFGCHLFGQCPLRPLAPGLSTIGPHVVDWPRPVLQVWAGINQCALKDSLGLWLWGQGSSTPELQPFQEEVLRVGLGLNFLIVHTA
jgi:alpha-tubulin suppressor-like RCC1 family protein